MHSRLLRENQCFGEGTNAANADSLRHFERENPRSQSDAKEIEPRVWKPLTYSFMGKEPRTSDHLQVIAESPADHRPMDEANVATLEHDRLKTSDYAYVIRALNSCGFEISMPPLRDNREHLYQTLESARAGVGEGNVVGLIRRKLANLAHPQTSVITGYRCLLSYDWDIHQGAPTWNALCHAAFAGHNDVVEWLLTNGAKVNEAAGEWTPVAIAAGHGHHHTVRLLLKHGAQVGNVDSPQEMNPLVTATRTQRVPIVQILTDALAKEIPSEYQSEITHSYKAAAAADAHSLVSFEASRGSESAQGILDPVHSISLELADIICAILGRKHPFRHPQPSSNRRADLLVWLRGLTDERGETDTLHALRESLRDVYMSPSGEFFSVCRGLWERGWSLDQQIDGFSLLHYAAQGGYNDAVEWLVDNGSSVNATTGEEPARTALDIATGYKWFSTIEMLLWQGAERSQDQQRAMPSPGLSQ